MALTTTDISNHFGITMRAEFVIDTLKVPNSGKDKRAFLWDASQVPAIGAALAAHASARGQAAATPGEKKVAVGNDDLF